VSRPPLDEIAAALDELLGPGLEAAFVYGSVATGRATAASDVDCLVVARGPITVGLRAEMRERFRALQLHLGYTPDLEHPVELFSLQRCREALAGGLVERALHAAARGAVTRDVTDGDDLEIVRSLVDHRFVVRSSPALDELSREARDAVRVGLLSLPRGRRAPACRALELPAHLLAVGA